MSFSYVSIVFVKTFIARCLVHFFRNCVICVFGVYLFLFLNICLCHLLFILIKR